MCSRAQFSCCHLSACLVAFSGGRISIMGAVSRHDLLLLTSVKWLRINLCCPISQSYVVRMTLGVENGRSTKASVCPAEQQVQPEPFKGNIVKKSCNSAKINGVLVFKSGWFVSSEVWSWDWLVTLMPRVSGCTQKLADSLCTIPRDSFIT